MLTLTKRFDKAGSIARMSDERMIRVENLKLLMQQMGIKTNVQMGKVLGRSDVYVGKLLSGKPGTFGEKTARAIEERCGKERFWLDVIHHGGQYTEETKRQNERAGQVLYGADTQNNHPASTGSGIPFIRAQDGAHRDTNFPMAPVVEWASLGENLYRANDEWPARDRREVPTTKSVSNLTKWVVVADDYLAPAVVPGDMVAIDPSGSPSRDEVALFRAADGEFLLRRWRPLPGGRFEAYDAAGRTLDGQHHGLSVVGAFVGVFKTKI